MRAVRALGEADLVLYDRLIDEKTLSFIRSGAEVIYVGKHHGQQEKTQAEIFALIASCARDGKVVARLKGGDPLVFGRGAEEWAVALESGMEVELVPGVSSAIAVPGLAGIPLTYRRLSQNFAVVTGHSQEGAALEWARYVGIDTLVILMGVKNRVLIASALIAAGRSPDEAVAFVERGATATEHLTESTLGEVAAGSVQAHNPAVFVVGEVVRLRSKLKP